ncbi:hypothetical protein [Ralstonia solanacearum]|uniref:hypothetical protein n=1 Tax=Ralstonia solanacearum TaxID=305 RepID=UPI0018D0818B|nr:hypothetical protein [Ralstonia solanacearum]
MAKANKRRDSSRDAGGFVAIPWAVLDSAAYQELSHPAKALLMEIARQYRGYNNGRMIAALSYLKPRGWTSYDTINRAKRELLANGLIYETVKGCRPNKASWYACTWWGLDRLDGYDFAAEAGFVRAAYRDYKVEKLKPLLRGTVQPAPKLHRHAV